MVLPLGSRTSGEGVAAQPPGEEIGGEFSLALAVERLAHAGFDLLGIGIDAELAEKALREVLSLRHGAIEHCHGERCGQVIALHSIPDRARLGGLGAGAAEAKLRGLIEDRGPALGGGLKRGLRGGIRCRGLAVLGRCRGFPRHGLPVLGGGLIGLGRGFRVLGGLLGLALCHDRYPFLAH